MGRLNSPGTRLRQFGPRRMRAWSANLSAAPSAPTGLAATAAVTSIGLTWNAVSGATSYNVYRSTTTGTETLYDTSATNSYTDIAPTPAAGGQAYFYKVSAVNATGESSLSSEVSGTAGARNLPSIASGAAYTFQSLLVDSVGGTSLTNNNAVTQDSSGIIGKAAAFVASSSQSLSRTSLGFSPKLSVTFWIKPNGNGLYFLTGDDDAAQNTGWLIQTLNSDNTNIAWFEGAGGSFGKTTTGLVTSATWHQILVVYNGTLTGNANRLKIWIDGAAQTLTFTGTIPATLGYVGASLTLGHDASASLFTNGSEDEYFIAPDDWSANAASIWNGGTGVTY